MSSSAIYWLFSSICLPVFAQPDPDPPPSANPARPTVSTPATLTPVGYLQFENGILGAVTSPEFSTRVAINQVTKLAVAPRLQLIMQSEPFIHSHFEPSRFDGGIGNAPGEVFGGVQGVLVRGKDKRPTISMSYIRRLHASPAPELDLGTYHQGTTFLLTTDVQGFHVDVNAIFNEQIEGPVRRAQFAQTLAVSHPWKRWTLSGELWHFTQPFTNSNAVGNLWAAAYTVRPNLVIDGGFQHGLTDTSTRWEVFAGFTYVLPYRLWKQR